MANAFSRTTRSLRSHTSRVALLMWAAVVALIGAWLAWFMLVNVPIYEVSQTARLEVERAARPVTTPIAGKIVRSALRLGMPVTAGDILVEFDAQGERLQLAEERARIDAIPPQLQALQTQIIDAEQAITLATKASEQAIAHARQKHQQALTGAEFEQDNLRRLKKLHASGRVTVIDMLRAQSDADQARSAAAALAAEIDRLRSAASSQRHQQRAGTQALRREMIELEGQMALSEATIARLQAAIDKHIVRAPIDGEVGAVAALDVGAFVTTGGVLASIIPTGTLKVVADYAPARVLGRVHYGQPALMRLDGFPWAQYGGVHATVDRVATEINNGLVRVEFAIDDRADSAFILQHGLTGSVEIKVEDITPAMLVLRASGQMISRPAAPTAVVTASIR